MNNLISETKKIFLEEVNENISSNINKISFVQINSLNIWNIKINDDSFIFIDLIKDFILKKLSEFIETLPLDNSNKTTKLNILLLFRFKFLDKIWEFWKVHCEKMTEVDLSLDVTKKMKKRRIWERLLSQSSCSIRGAKV
jgi:hypothetical protein